MQLQTAIFILVAALLQYGDCQGCVNTNTCLPPVAGARGTYNTFANPQCTGTATNTNAAGVVVPLRCPVAFPSCFGGLFGVTVGSTTIGTGPCLATPVCTTAGVFPILNNGNGTRNLFACGAFYRCSGPGAVSLNFGCTTFGDEFNAVTGACEPPTTAGCSLPLAAPGAPVPPGPPGAPVPPVVPGAAPACSGLGAKVADPTSCRHYFKCGLFGRRTRRRCLFNQIFSTVSNNCSSGTNCGTRPLV